MHLSKTQYPVGQAPSAGRRGIIPFSQDIHKNSFRKNPLKFLKLAFFLLKNALENDNFSAKSIPYQQKALKKLPLTKLFEPFFGLKSTSIAISAFPLSRIELDRQVQAEINY